MDRRDDRPNPDMACWTEHQVASSGCSTAPQVAYRFEALQEPLPCLSPFQATAVRSRSRVGTWLRSTALVIPPRAQCRPVRMWRAPGHVVATALM